MFKLLLPTAFLLISHVAWSQCLEPQAQIDIHANNIKARILNGGDLFTDFDNSQFIPDPVAGVDNPGTIFAAGLWLGGLDPAGNLKTSAAHYRYSSGTDFRTGPLTEDGLTDDTNCANWDRLFKVEGSEIAAFLAALPMTPAEIISQFPSIAGWPAIGNPYFVSIYGFDLPLTGQSLAPFFDHDQDGLYNPMYGDYPAVGIRNHKFFPASEIIWCVFNDQGNGAPHSVTGGQPFPMEVQLTAWAFDCPGIPVINNTIFTSHKIIYRGLEPIDSFYAGLWVDMDLGCYFDDYLGCDPSRNTMFAYNQDAVDGINNSSCNGIPTFNNNPPVQTVMMFGAQPFVSLNKFMAINTQSPVGFPSKGYEYYRLLSGSWTDGTPLTYGGFGYGGVTPTDFAYPGDPGTPNDWTMCSTSASSEDRFAVGSFYLETLHPGAVTELDAAWTVHHNIAQPCNIGDALSNVDQLKAYIDSDWAGVCSILSNVPPYPSDSVDLFPNPTNDQATLRYNNLNVNQILIFDALGRLVQSIDNPDKGETVIHGENLASGMYLLQILSEEGKLTKKLVVSGQ
ncbi:MAG: T9SS type A sorting domain-containing protein [Saprospiraceae bacterium]